jgi:ectoine hydroxylase-related dioxygenase (phytanoyl-CoA dioxygenase family)
LKYSHINDGFEIVEDVLGREAVEMLRGAVAELPSRHRGGVRNLLQNSEAIAALAISDPVKALAKTALGVEAFSVRALLFDKAPAANWKVPWHQDTAIAVAERVEVPGFVGWSVKDGVTHVHPPVEILERMMALRIHLDDCGPDNGPLRVLPGSHRHGKLDEAQIEHWRQTTAEVRCCAMQGDVLVMRPLLLHASSPAKAPSHRRVIHLEYACGALPNGMRWFEQTTPTMNSPAFSPQPLP